MCLKIAGGVRSPTTVCIKIHGTLSRLLRVGTSRVVGVILRLCTRRRRRMRARRQAGATSVKHGIVSRLTGGNLLLDWRVQRSPNMDKPRIIPAMEDDHKLTSHPQGVKGRAGTGRRVALYSNALVVVCGGCGQWTASGWDPRLVMGTCAPPPASSTANLGNRACLGGPQRCNPPVR